MRYKKLLIALIVSLTTITIVNTQLVSGLITTEIVIDGELSDWNDISPIVVEETIDPSKAMDLQYGYITNNASHLFFRMDFAEQYEYPMIFANVTIQIPNGSVYIIMSQVVYDSEPYWSFSAVFNGSSLDSPYNAPTPNHALAEHQDGWSYVDSSNTTLEFAILLEDLDIDDGDEIQFVFWHFDDQSAGLPLFPMKKDTTSELVYFRYPLDSYASFTINKSQTVAEFSLETSIKAVIIVSFVPIMIGLPVFLRKKNKTT
jgi:hypothetical protein